MTLTETEPPSHSESQLQYRDIGYCQYPDRLRWSIQKVSHQSHDRPTPAGIEKINVFFSHLKPSTTFVISY